VALKPPSHYGGKLLTHGDRRSALRDASGRYPDAISLANKLLANQTTDPCYDDLAQWLSWAVHDQTRRARLLTPKVITHPRLARPAGRVNQNPYLPR